MSLTRCYRKFATAGCPAPKVVVPEAGEEAGPTTGQRESNGGGRGAVKVCVGDFLNLTYE